MRQRKVNTVSMFPVGKKKIKDFCSANLNPNTDSGKSHSVSSHGN